MNTGLIQALGDAVLFLDDDIIPAPDLVAAHASAYTEGSVTAVVGQVLQPDEQPRELAKDHAREGLKTDLGFAFSATERVFVRNVMAGNFSVRRSFAVEIGGFDENFVGSAYRFETEFARRVWARGGMILFEPSARVRHLRAERGGTRSRGGHMASGSPLHGVGDYYFALTQGVSLSTISYMARRPFREIRTRFHLANPWWIPVKFVGEIRAILLAVRLWRQGPRYIEHERSSDRGGVPEKQDLPTV